jgi:adenylate kinase
MRTIVLLGPPGAGKGTQASTLASRESLLHLSTGEMLREAVAQGSDLGLRVKSIVESGQLVPDDVVAGVVRERLERGGLRQGVLFDGFPRTVAQAALLADIVADLGLPTPVAIELEVPDEDVVGRLSARRECRSCGPRPAGEATCGQCGGALTRRADDAPEVVRGRLAVYHAQTAPLSEHYRKLAALRVVDGRGSPDQVADRVARAARSGQA